MTKPTVYMTKGLPASGKSTWAKDMVEKSYSAGNRKLKRVSKDDLRAMLDNGHHSKANEALVLRIRDMLIHEAIGEGCNVIVDDTNLNPIHEQHIRDSVTPRANFEVVNRFLEVPLEECVARDLKRPNSVGAEVIERMHHQYIQKGTNYVKPPAPEHVEDVPDAIIVDLDGTLALMGDRSPYAGEQCAVDSVNEPILKLVMEWWCDYNAAISKPDRHVIFCSGRDGKAREATILWLREKCGIYVEDEGVHLFMRAPGDNRNDGIIKEEIYRENIEGNFNVAFVLDDRNRVVDKWRELGLTCLQVAPGNF